MPQRFFLHDLGQYRYSPRVAMCIILASYSIQAVYDSVFEPETIGSFAFVPMNKSFHRVSVGRH